jgi:hypothetical protein
VDEQRQLRSRVCVSSWLAVVLVGVGNVLCERVRVPGRSPKGVLTRVITWFLPTFLIRKIIPWVITSFNPDRPSAICVLE